MSTYSLTLRQRKGRRLSISELDNNWLYLKELAELGGTSSGPSGDFPIREYGVSYDGYLVSELSRIGIVELISGSFASGDTISGSSSGATGDIVHILESDTLILFVNNISGKFTENVEYINNQTQPGVGEFGLFNPDLTTGNIAISNGDNQFSTANIIWGTGSTSGIASIFISTTYSLSQYDIIIQSNGNNFNNDFNALGIISLTYSTITLTYLSFVNNSNFGTNMIMSDSTFCMSHSKLGCCGTDYSSFALSCQGPMWGFNDNNFILPKDSPSSCGQPMITLGCGSGYIELGWGPTYGPGSIDGLSIGQNTIVGLCAAINNNGTSNIFIGCHSGESLTIADYNTIIGYCSAQCTTSINNSVLIGHLSGVLACGSDNVFIGNASGFCNNCGSCNTYIGTNVGYNNCNGIQNTFIGSQVGFSSQGSANTMVGQQSGYSAIGCSNVFIGKDSGCCFSGCFNTHVGVNAGSACCGNICNTIALGAHSQPELNGDFAIGSTLAQISTGTTAFDGGVLTTVTNYLCVIINGTRYKLALFE